MPTCLGCQLEFEAQFLQNNYCSFCTVALKTKQVKETQQNTVQIKIISGGQTDVDRAALDAALECGIDCGGWCPEGRQEEDGIILEKYPLKELPQGDYKARTKQNVIDSDGTIIIYFGTPVGGTELTLRYCIDTNTPYCLIDAEEISIARAVQKIQLFTYGKHTINIAGPRASSEPDAYEYAKAVVTGFLKDK